MDINKIKLIAFDLDGTLTQHKTPLSPEHREVLDNLSKKYKLLMVGAGMCNRIFEQMGHYPIDIIGNYGLEFAEYDHEKNSLVCLDLLPHSRGTLHCLFCNRGHLLA